MQPSGHTITLGDGATLEVAPGYNAWFEGTVTVASDASATIVGDELFFDSLIDVKAAGMLTLDGDSIDISTQASIDLAADASLTLQGVNGTFWWQAVQYALGTSNALQFDGDLVLSADPALMPSTPPWNADEMLIDAEVADLDGDGDKDFVTLLESSEGARTLAWFELDDSGGPLQWTRHEAPMPLASPEGLLIVELTSDETPELVVHGQDGMWWLHNTESTMNRFVAPSENEVVTTRVSKNWITPGDSDPIIGQELLYQQDFGCVDLQRVIGSWSPGHEVDSSVIQWGCSSQFTQHYYASKVVYGDFDGDDTPDYFGAVHYDNWTASLYFLYELSSWNGQINLPRHPFGSNQDGYFGVDLDGDGAKEFLSQAVRFEIYDFVSDPDVSDQIVFDPDIEDGAEADMNGDSDSDLVVITNEGLWWFDNQTAYGRSISPRRIDAVPGAVVAIGDLDNDGDDDVVTDQGLYINDETSSFITVETGATISATGEIRVRTSVLDTEAGAMISAGGGFRVEPGASLAGAGTINADSLNLGGIQPARGQTLTLNGALSFDGVDVNSSPRSGRLLIDLGGSNESPEPTMLHVTGSASLSGGLRVDVDPLFDPMIGSEFEILRADGGVVDRFDVALMDPLPDGKFFTVDYRPDSVWLMVSVLDGNVGFDPENPQSVNGLPTAAVLGDVTGDDLLDVVVTVAGPDASNDPGTFVILKNASFAANGAWTGYQNAAVYANAQIGVLPSAVDVGDLDNDGDLDIAVANFGTPNNPSPDTVTVIVNEIVDGNLTVGTAEVFSVQTPNSGGDAPSDLRIGRFNADPYLDIMVVNSASGDFTIMAGLPPFINWPDFDFPAPPMLPEDEDEPWAVEPGEINPLREPAPGGGDWPQDIVVAARGTGSLLVYENVGESGAFEFAPPIAVPVGEDPIGVIVRELNPVEGENEFPDLVSVNGHGNSVSVARNSSVSAATTFAPSVELPVAETPSDPSSIAAGDFDDDGDHDLAVIADGESGRVVKVFRNDQFNGQLQFAAVQDVVAGSDPLIVLAGDVNNDSVDDIVTVGGGSGQLRGQDENVVPSTGVVCRADLTTQNAPVGSPGYGRPDGLVTNVNLQYYVNGWLAGDETIADVTTTDAGRAEPGYATPDGQVTSIDLQFFANRWIEGCQ